jgi:hypothetical protein
MSKQTTPSTKYQEGWLSELDGRTGIAQVMRERFQELTDDLGGVESLSYQQRSLVERSLWLEYWLSEQERRLSKGAEFDVGKWVQAANSLQGLYGKLGLVRVPREVKDIADYLSTRKQHEHN